MYFCTFGLLLLLVIVYSLLSNSVYLKKSSFDPDVADILYHGDAASSSGVIELINSHIYICRVGWATLAKRVPLWDSNSGQVSDFTTHFTFIIGTQGQSQSTYGDGLAFFLSAAGFEIPPNSAGGFLGLFNTSTIDDTSKNQIVMVEFDSFRNAEWDPQPVMGHVGINSKSLSSVVYTGWNASFHSGDTADVWISYSGSSKNLSVSWSHKNTVNPQENSSLHCVIDLTKVLPEFVSIGFSAATGAIQESVQILSWEFNSTLEINE
ncbi:L-type lectin-domain containing receptor kinase IX.1-like [Jatropha curcas]|uniref:L-type lectin-domain containing receptor kinase IX.1-like n=1 Tax=Jatropha curcas TaxID=180498 RepID=UPI001892E5E8|nr:L-type lectin-domain containing receptor kinase IX.1-like [Jatropha curcas]